MLITENADLISSNLYEYDFKSCFYNILKNIDYDLKDIPYEDKKVRNIKLGLLQKNNPNLSIYLNSTVNSLINHYLKLNNLTDDNVILRQKDGIITNIPLKILNNTMEISFKGNISKLISSINKDKILIIYIDGNVISKGIKNKTLDMTFYNLFSKLNFENKNQLIKGLERLRIEIFESTNIRYFTRELDNKFYIPIKTAGIMQFQKSMINNIKIEDVDKSILWSNYVWPFVQSILLTTQSRET